jgi:hypothetical protein
MNTEFVASLLRNTLTQLSARSKQQQQQCVPENGNFAPHLIFTLTHSLLGICIWKLNARERFVIKI